MPQGKTIFYDLDRPTYTVGRENIQPKSHTTKILIHNISANEVVLMDETADNRNMAVARQELQTVGEAREIARNLNIGLEEQLRANGIRVVIEPQPEGYADGQRIGAGGNVGMLQVVLDDRRRSKEDEYGVCDLDSQYQKLLKYAQHMKQNANSYGYQKVEIDCCDEFGEKQGEKIKPIPCKKEVFHVLCIS